MRFNSIIFQYVILAAILLALVLTWVAPVPESSREYFSMILGALLGVLNMEVKKDPPPLPDIPEVKVEPKKSEKKLI